MSVLVARGLRRQLVQRLQSHTLERLASGTGQERLYRATTEIGPLERRGLGEVEAQEVEPGASGRDARDAISVLKRRALRHGEDTARGYEAASNRRWGFPRAPSSIDQGSPPQSTGVPPRAKFN
jgi:hypothetical protein